MAELPRNHTLGPDEIIRCQTCGVACPWPAGEPLPELEGRLCWCCNPVGRKPYTSLNPVDMLIHDMAEDARLARPPIAGLPIIN